MSMQNGPYVNHILRGIQEALGTLAHGEELIEVARQHRRLALAFTCGVEYAHALGAVDARLAADAAKMKLRRLRNVAQALDEVSS
jgi:hypothetical protein